MGNYTSAYSGAEIDTAIAKINDLDLSTIDALQDKTTLNVSNTSNATVMKLGDLIIQREAIVLAFNVSETRNFPQAFPHQCLFVGVQGVQLDANSGYSAPNTIQAIPISASQYRTYMNSTVANATMGAHMIAIGY